MTIYLISQKSGDWPGVEITAIEDGVKFHVLGYGIDPTNEELISYSRDFLDTMNRRSLYQIRMLQQDGIAIPEEEFLKKQALAIAHSRNLMVTGGTDYHGRYKMDPDLPEDEELTGEVRQSMEPLMRMGRHNQ